MGDKEVVEMNEVTEPVIAKQPKKKIAIAIPGDHSTSKFLVSWTSALNVLWETQKYDIIISPGVSSYVTFARMQTLGLDVLRGIQQKPFNNLDFDVWVTIDSDIIFTPQQLIDLIEATDIHPVVSGMYRMSDLTHYAIVKEWNTDFFVKNGTFEFLTPEFVEKWKQETGLKYMSVNYTGMGFFAMRRDVLRKMTYPYFNAELQEIISDEGTILRDICSEDVAFCKNIQKTGVPIVVNTELRVGHHKLISI